MFIRVVRFSGVSPERIEEMKGRIEGSEGPPDGVPSTGIKVGYDADQQVAVVLQSYSSAEDMAAGAAVLEQMPTEDTPGTRETVDACEIRIEMDAS